MKKCFLFDGQIYSKNSFEVGIYDRGFNFSDGFFETFYFDGHKIQNNEYHLQRIIEACKLYDFYISNEFLSSLFQKIDELNSHLDFGKKMFKLIVWRKQGGLFSPESNDFHYLISAREKTTTELSYIENIGIEKIEGFCKNYFSGVKNLSCYQYLKAGMSVKKHNWNDCIILNQENHITESLYGNIFWIKENEIFTPSLSTGCINGIIRRKILEQTQVQEGEFQLNDLLEADFVFFSNVGGIKIISKTNEVEFLKNQELENFVFNLYMK